MRKLFDEMRERCEEFLAQRDDALLVASAGPAEYVALFATLDALEKGESPDFFWLFAEPFESAAAYADSVARAFRARWDALGAKLAEAGDPPLPALPAEAVQPDEDPVRRMRALIGCARGIVPDVEGSHVVWGLLPSEISDAHGWARFVVDLMRHELPVPWFHHARLVVREHRDEPVLHRVARTMPRARWYSPDLGPAAIEKALEDEAADGAAPLPRRMQALFVLAGLDLAQRRLEGAAEKYGLLARYYGATGEKPLCALSLNGLGEVAERGGRSDLARETYERALTPAVASQSLPALVNVTLNLANLHGAQGRFGDAFEHYVALSSLAKASCNAPLQIRCLEQMGYCRHRLGDAKGAFEHWTAGRTLAKGVEAEGELLGCLERLRGLFRELGMRKERGEVERDIAELERRGVKAWPA